MLREGLEKIEEMVIEANNIHEVCGKIYSIKDMKPLKEFAVIEPLQVNTLTGFCDYINKFPEKIIGESLLVVVKSPTSVYMMSALVGEWQQRQTYIMAKPIIEPFGFGNWYDHQSFMIAMHTHFAETEDRINILALAASVTQEANEKNTDDGNTQKVAVRRGVSLSGEKTIPNPVTLKPYRTFVEIEQPESRFIFRVQTGLKGNVKFSLHEVISGEWQREAIKSIQEFLTGKIDNKKVTIIA